MKVKAKEGITAKATIADVIGPPTIRPIKSTDNENVIPGIDVVHYKVRVEAGINHQMPEGIDPNNI